MAMRRGWIIAGVLLALGWFGHNWWESGKLTQDTALELGREQYDDKTYCHVGVTEIHWPCVRVTDVEVDRSTSELGSRDESRVCYDLSIDLETTRWNPGFRTPDDPRTYTPAGKPLNLCHTASRFGPFGWSITPENEEPWWQPITEGLWEAQCRQGPCE